jgi:small conductance mechanosensitive channel
MDSLRAEAALLRDELEGAPPDAVVEVRATVQGHEERTDEVFRFSVDLLDQLEALGLPSKATRDQLVDRLPSRAEALSGRLELARDRLDTALAQSHANLGDQALDAAVGEAEDRLDALASSLWITCDLMDELGLPTAEHRQVLIRTTREITGDIFDLEVATGLIEQGSTAVLRWIERRGPGMAGRTAIFVVVVALFWVLGAIVRRILARALRASTNVSEIARRVLVATASRVVVTIGVFVALAQIDVNVTALLTGLGIAGFIAGFALQDTLGNFAAGAMILMYRPFDVGDVIEAAGVYGTVHNTTLVSTTILTFDNQTLVVPNSKIWGDVIRNVTAQTVRRIDLSFGLAHTADLERAEKLFRALLRDHPKVLEDPEPVVHVHQLTESAVEFVVRPWARREDYWEAYWDLTREAKLRLDREGIALAVPHRQARIEQG